MSELHTESYGLNTEALARYVERIEGLDVERQQLNSRVRVVYDEAKKAGFQPPIVRQIVRERKLEPEVRNDQYRLLDQYRAALGLYADTELGAWAMQRAADASGWPLKNPVVERPRPFAEQTVHEPRRRGRPRKDFAETAREFFGGEPV